MRRQVAFRPIENLNASVGDLKLNQRLEDARSPPSKRNITFSYSNKDLNKSKMFIAKRVALPQKRASIQIDLTMTNLP